MFALILAAGKGTRLDKGKEKAFVPLLGKPLLAWTLSVFASCPHIHEIIVVVPPGRTMTCKNTVLSPYGFEKARVVVGGAEREDSLRNGFAAIEEACQVVVVHDGARPFVTVDLIEEGVGVARKTGAAVAAVPVKDTIKLADSEKLIKETLQRDRLWAAQTPQIFSFDVITKAYDKLAVEVTDDAAAVEHLGYKVKLYMGDYNNIKVTTPEDLALARVIAGKWKEGE